VARSANSAYREDNAGYFDLVKAHLSLVKRVAAHMRMRLGNQVELEELIQVGTMGLIEAAQSFESQRGIPFEAYAITRVKGSIIDSIRQGSPHSRDDAKFRKDEDAAHASLANILGRKPNEIELATQLGLSLTEYQSAKRKATISIEDIESLYDEVSQLRGADSNQPDEILIQKENVTRLANAIEQLDERKKLIISLYYVEDLNLKEIASVIDVTEARVSQILSSTIKSLRALLI
jgi:RNA polymerase sigma factor for flagellar operon FliA